MHIFRAFFAVVVALIASGCATDVVRQQALLTPVNDTARSRIEISTDVETQSSSGYSRVLPGGSVWELRGNIPQGAVYKRVNDIFTIEGAHVHEAYIVLDRNRLVGFYLPADEAYSPAEPVLLTLK